MGTVAADGHARFTGALPEKGPVRCGCANPGKRAEVKFVGDNESRIAKDSKVESIPIERMVQDGGLEPDDERASGSDGDDLVCAVWRVEGIRGFPARIDACRFPESGFRVRKGWRETGAGV